MTASPFNFETLYAANVPPPAPKWTGFPEFNFVGGHNAPEAIPVDDLIAATNEVLADEGRSLAMYRLHSGPLGYLPLREFLVRKLARQAGISCTSDDILITSGSGQAIELVNQMFLSPGDTILVEQSTYGGCLTRFARYGARILPVEMDSEGMRMESLSSILKSLRQEGVRPKFIYTIPTVQNPTGSILPLDRRHELLRIAAEYDVAIFEDECYSDLIWNGERPPALHALDTDGRVIFCSTFSKSIAPALRVGYLVAGEDVLARAVACKVDSGTGALEQMVLARYCEKHFDAHVERLNRLLKDKLDIMTQSVNEHFGTSAEFEVPPGGIFLWLKLSEPVDTTKLARLCAERNLAINPGAEWSKDLPDAQRHLRLCFASASPDDIRNGVAELANLCHETFGIPPRSANVVR